MRYKLLTLFLIITKLVIGSTTYQDSVVRSKFSQDQITKMLKDFYTDLGVICSDPYHFSLEKVYSLKKLNCTANYFKEIEKQGMLDYDPLINAQDFSPDALKTLTIKKDLQKDDIYYVSYITSYDKRQITIKLKIVKEKEAYKIDHVFLDSQKKP